MGPIDVPCTAKLSGRAFDSQRCTDREVFGWAQYALNWTQAVSGAHGGGELAAGSWKQLYVHQIATRSKCLGGNMSLAGPCDNVSEAPRMKEVGIKPTA